MATAGRKAKVRVSGSPLTLTDQATSTSDDLTFTITAPTKRVLAPEADITVEVDGVAADPANYDLNRLQGKVTFDSAQTGAAVTITGKYLPLSNAAEAYEFSYTLEADNQTAPVFQSDWQRRIQAKIDFTASLSQYYADKTFIQKLIDGNIVIVEFYINGNLDIKAWSILSSGEPSASADGLVEEAIEFEGTTDKEERAVSI